MAGKTFPVSLAHAQPAILRIWQEAHNEIVASLIVTPKKMWNIYVDHI